MMTIYSPLLRSSLLAGRSLGHWIELIDLGKQGRVLRLPIVNFQRMQDALAGEAGLLAGRFHIQQQGFELGCPLLLLLFCQKGQLAQQMNETESMRTGIQEVGVPAIVDASPRKPWQDADGIQGGFSSLGMNRVMGELGGTGHMHPVPQAVDVEARFFLMENVGFHQRFLDLLLDFGQLRATALDQARQRALADLDPRQVSEHFTGSGPGQELLLHDQLWHLHIYHLSTFDLQRGYRLQIGCSFLSEQGHQHVLYFL